MTNKDKKNRINKKFNNLLINFFKINNLEYQNKKFVLAVSTGVDSSVLLDLFLKFREQYNIDISVAHVNHHRREQSNEEQKYINFFCLNNNIKLFVKELHFEDSSNFQSIARNFRYEFFDEVMKEVNGDYLVLAHHGDDNLETVLMRIMRGSSLAGYGGIREVYSKNNTYKIIRPLLGISKDEIINYQVQENIKYYEDESNTQKDYARNRVRIDIIPMMKEECPELIDKINEYSKIILEAAEIVNEKRDVFINEYVQKICKGTNKISIKINRNKLLEESSFMQVEILFELVKKYNLSKSNIEELLKVIKSDKKNYKVYFKGLFDFIIAYDDIFINDFHEEENEEINIQIEKTGIYKVNDNYQLIVTEKDDNFLPSSDDLWYNIVSLPVTVRTRKPGDKISLKIGEKKIKDILIDMKIPQNKRDKVLLVEKNIDKPVILSILGLKKSKYLTNIDDCDIIIRLVKL